MNLIISLLNIALQNGLSLREEWGTELACQFLYNRAQSKSQPKKLK